MKNIELTTQENTLILTINLNKSQGPSESGTGKSFDHALDCLTVIATTSGSGNKELAVEWKNHQGGDEAIEQLQAIVEENS